MISRPHDNRTLDVLRDGKRITVDVTLMPLPDKMPRLPNILSVGEKAPPRRRARSPPGTGAFTAWRSAAVLFCDLVWPVQTIRSRVARAGEEAGNTGARGQHREPADSRRIPGQVEETLPASPRSRSSRCRRRVLPSPGLSHLRARRERWPGQGRPARLQPETGLRRAGVSRLRGSYSVRIPHPACRIRSRKNCIMSCLAMLSGERFCDQRSKACSMAAIVWGSCFVSSVSTRIHTQRNAPHARRSISR